LEWGRFPDALTDLPRGHVPSLLWRFDLSPANREQADHAIDTLRSVLDDFEGQVSWTLTHTGKNWFLCPTRRYEMISSGKFNTTRAAFEYYYHEEPDLGVKAGEDLMRITGEFAKRLGIELSMP